MAKAATTINDALSQRRRTLRQSLSEAAADLGTTKQSLSQWEHGSIPDRESLSEIAKYLGVSLPTAKAMRILAVVSRESRESQQTT